MALIEVNHKVLRDVAAAITTYCSAQDKEMRAADSDIKSILSSDWIGLDAQEFGRKWEGVDANDSTTVKFRESLKSFGESLTACANEYQSAQEDAYNAANRLPKYLYW
ncbi:Type VII secretion system ESAT-6-like [Desulfitobacterium hafniense]|uniref:Type VII secretion system ESAT-6-like n=1 Tax=Desulfitobacterium hafniense TaxID=49338 RepID=A0A098B9A1_DESHA|nr:hypothetical protein [Desulfitobacterium hafniense]CDX04950.1 Type VII secretion system ESAT-6-like [Desulfitobacterium hafniense]